MVLQIGGPWSILWVIARHEKTREYGSTAPGIFFRIAEIINKFEVQNVEIVLEIAKLGNILIKYC